MPVPPPPSSMGPPLLVITCQTIKKYHSKTRVDYPPVGIIFVSDKLKKNTVLMAKGAGGLEFGTLSLDPLLM